MRGCSRRGLEILFEDRLAYPRFSGDKALVSGFMKNGYSAELARRRIALGVQSGCPLPGLEYTMNDLVKINMAKVFEVAFQEYQETIWQSSMTCSAKTCWRRSPASKRALTST